MALAPSSDPPPLERRGVNIQRSFRRGVWTGGLNSGEGFLLRGLGLNSVGAGVRGTEGWREGVGYKTVCGVGRKVVPALLHALPKLDTVY